MNSTMSGWSTFKITILAARRVLPPLLITPAKASKPFMKLTGPEAMPPPERASRLPRSEERSEEHTSELQSRSDLVCRLLLEKKKKTRAAYLSYLASNESPDVKRRHKVSAHCRCTTARTRRQGVARELSPDVRIVSMPRPSHA